jgi:hypothetical protein
MSFASSGDKCTGYFEAISCDSFQCDERNKLCSGKKSDAQANHIRK